MFIIQITRCMACYIFVRFKDSLRFSQSNRKHQGVNLSCLDRIYIDDFFVKKCGEIGIVSGSLFSNHAHVIMVVGKQPYHNSSCGHYREDSWQQVGWTRPQRSQIREDGGKWASTYRAFYAMTSLDLDGSAFGRISVGRRCSGHYSWCSSNIERTFEESPLVERPMSVRQTTCSLNVESVGDGRWDAKQISTLILWRSTRFVGWTD